MLLPTAPQLSSVHRPEPQRAASLAEDLSFHNSSSSSSSSSGGGGGSEYADVRLRQTADGKTRPKSEIGVSGVVAG